LDCRAVSGGGEVGCDPAEIRMDAFGLDVLGIALMGERVVVIEPVLADRFPCDRDPDCYQREAAVDFDACSGIDVADPVFEARTRGLKVACWGAPDALPARTTHPNARKARIARG
jgi:hypothetical protein